MTIQRLIYCSTATRLPGDQELARLVEQTRIHNYSQNITGVLVHAEGHFLQVLEGEAPAVAELYERIRHDSRHTNVITMYDAPITRRLFVDWNMGFGSVNITTLNRLCAFLNPKHQAALLPANYDARVFVTDLLREFVEDELLAPRRLPLSM